MSLGYAEKLSFIEDVGQVGMTEFFDRPAALEGKIEKLASLIRKSKHLVAFTGAGISTSSGIPDFRGPKGIWTLQQEGNALPEASLPFHRAMPSITHMALVELEKAGILKFIISQNVDGLHLRSGIPREKLAELHGNSFMEVCSSCGAEYLRDFEVETIGLKETSRRCSIMKCRARLRDTVLDWEDALPLKEMNKAEKHCKRADIILCLGSSLQITPACNLPLKCLRGGGKIIIVNLQKTPKDRKACLVIHGLVDKVIRGVLSLLSLHVPPFIRIDFVEVALTPVLSSDEKSVDWTLRVSSIHGRRAPLQFIDSVEVIFGDDSNLNALLHKKPYVLKRRIMDTKPLDAVLKFTFGEGCACARSDIKVGYYLVGFGDGTKINQEAVYCGLKESAISEPWCGQNALVERWLISRTSTEVSVYAIVTNTIDYHKEYTQDDDDSKIRGKRANCIRNSGKRQKKQ